MCIVFQRQCQCKNSNASSHPYSLSCPVHIKLQSSAHKFRYATKDHFHHFFKIKVILTLSPHIPSGWVGNTILLLGSLASQNCMRIWGYKWSQESEEELLMSSVAWSLPPSSPSVPAVVSASLPLSGVSMLYISHGNPC